MNEEFVKVSFIVLNKILTKKVLNKSRVELLKKNEFLCVHAQLDTGITDGKLLFLLLSTACMLILSGTAKVE